MMRLILGVSVVIAAAKAVAADDSALIGVWSGADRASQAIYGTMHIGKNEISWGGGNPYNPYCKTTYTLVANYSDTTYPDNPFQLFAGRTFNIYKLKLNPQPCTEYIGYFQFALPSGTDGYMLVVTYDVNERKTGSHDFGKVGDQPGVSPTVSTEVKSDSYSRCDAMTLFEQAGEWKLLAMPPVEEHVALAILDERKLFAGIIADGQSNAGTDDHDHVTWFAESKGSYARCSYKEDSHCDSVITRWRNTSEGWVVDDTLVMGSSSCK